MPAPIDPSTLAMELWCRGSYAGSPWTSEASTGGSGGRTLTQASTPPSVGTSLNGYDTADFDGTNDRLDGLALSTYATTTAYSGWALVYLDTIGIDAGANDDITIVTTSGTGIFTIYLSDNGAGTVKAWIRHYVPSDKFAEVTFTSSAWNLIQWRYDGTNIAIRVNGGAWASTAAGSLFSVTATIEVGRNVNQTVYMDGRIEELGLSKVSFDDSTFDGVLAYVDQRYGLQLSPAPTFFLADAPERFPPRVFGTSKQMALAAPPQAPITTAEALAWATKTGLNARNKAFFGSNYDPTTGAWTDGVAGTSWVQAVAGSRPAKIVFPSGATGLLFDGTDDYLSAGTRLILPNGGHRITYLVHRLDGYGIYGYNAVFSTQPNVTTAIQFSIGAGGTVWYNWGAPDPSIDLPGDFGMGVYLRLIFVENSTTGIGTLYVNGAADANTLNMVSNSVDYSTLLIGASNEFPGPVFFDKGVIAALGFAHDTTAFSADDIASLDRALRDFVHLPAFDPAITPSTTRRGRGLAAHAQMAFAEPLRERKVAFYDTSFGVTTRRQAGLPVHEQMAFADPRRERAAVAYDRAIAPERLPPKLFDPNKQLAAPPFYPQPDRNFVAFETEAPERTSRAPGLRANAQQASGEPRLPEYEILQKVAARGIAPERLPPKLLAPNKQLAAPPIYSEPERKVVASAALAQPGTAKAPGLRTNEQQALGEPRILERNIPAFDAKAPETTSRPQGLRASIQQSLGEPRLDEYDLERKKVGAKAIAPTRLPPRLFQPVEQLALAEPRRAPLENDPLVKYVSNGGISVPAGSPITLTYPVGVQFDQGLLLFVFQYTSPPAVGTATPSDGGWLLLGQLPTYDPFGIGPGQYGGTISVFFKAALGSESGNITVTTSPSPGAFGVIANYVKASSTATWLPVMVTGNFAATTTPAITFSANPNLSARDLAVIFGESYNGGSWSSEVLAAAGAVLDAFVERADGSGYGGLLGDAAVQTGTSTATPTFSASVGPSTYGGLTLVRLRAAEPPPPVSATITVDTTKRIRALLTANVWAHPPLHPLPDVRKQQAFDVIAPARFPPKHLRPVDQLASPVRGAYVDRASVAFDALYPSATRCFIGLPSSIQVEGRNIGIASIPIEVRLAGGAAEERTLAIVGTIAAPIDLPFGTPEESAHAWATIGSLDHAASPSAAEERNAGAPIDATVMLPLTIVGGEETRSLAADLAVGADMPIGGGEIGASAASDLTTFATAYPSMAEETRPYAIIGADAWALLLAGGVAEESTRASIFFPDFILTLPAPGAEERWSAFTSALGDVAATMPTLDEEGRSNQATTTHVEASMATALAEERNAGELTSMSVAATMPAPLAEERSTGFVLDVGGLTILLPQSGAEEIAGGPIQGWLVFQMPTPAAEQLGTWLTVIIPDTFPAQCQISVEPLVVVSLSVSALTVVTITVEPLTVVSISTDEGEGV